MFSIVKEAVKNYIDSIEGDIKECDSQKIEGFVSKIDIKGDENYDIFIVVPHEKLLYLANYYFGDERYDCEDLTKEIANQIIGNAKIVATKKDKNFEIGIPEFLGEYNDKIEFDEKLAFKFNGDKCFYILFKEK